MIRGKEKEKEVGWSEINTEIGSYFFKKNCLHIYFYKFFCYRKNVYKFKKYLNTIKRYQKVVSWEKSALVIV